jgi:hypothetical protein
MEYDSDHPCYSASCDNEHHRPTSIRTFASGATRDADKAEDPEGFLHPRVVLEFTAYMAKHRKQADGAYRSSDNWQKGIPKDAYIKSAWRHFLDIWLHHRGYASSTREALIPALCALLFNVQGYLLETLKAQDQHEAAKASDK